MKFIIESKCFGQKLMFKVSLKQKHGGQRGHLTFKIISLPYSTTVDENSTFKVRWEQPGHRTFSKVLFSSLSPRCFFPQSKTTSRSSQMLTSFMVISEYGHKIAKIQITVFFLDYKLIFVSAKSQNITDQPLYSLVQCK